VDSVHETPTVRINEQVRSAFSLIQTKYVCNSGDDDFHVYNGLRKILCRLEADETLSVCSGLGIQVNTVESNEPIGQTKFFKQTMSMWNDPFTRVRNYIALFSNLSYAVHRTDVWKFSYASLNEFEFPNTFVEILQAVIPLALGKVDRLNEVYVLRHSHHRNAYSTVEQGDTSLDIFHDTFLSGLRRFSQRVIDLLRSCNVDMPEDAREQIESSLKYMAYRNSVSLYGVKPRDWFPEPEGRETVAFLLEQRDKFLMDTLRPGFNAIRDNTINGLNDPRTQSFV
jgi:glycosyltransferase domain-containing protein